MKNHAQRAGQRSAALIITLVALALLSLLVISLAITVQIDLRSANYFKSRIQAEMMARQGISTVQGILTQTVPTVTNNWISMPGQIVTFSGATPTVVGLYSAQTNGAPSTGIYAPPDLNRKVISEDSIEAINPGGAAMKVGWIYVRSDGSLDGSPVPTTNTANPIVGRFAYWTDNESDRVNLNTAWKRANNASAATNWLTSVSLPALTNTLTPALADSIQQAATTNVFNSPDEPRRLPGLANIISGIRFNITHYNHSDMAALTPWGTQKIVLTTRAALTSGTGSTNYLNLGVAPSKDPGSLANINSATTLTTLNRVYSLLQNNWPASSGVSGSFAAKYGTAVNNAGAAQLAVDIVDYVRSVESTSQVVEPFRGLAASATTIAAVAGTPASQLLGNSRRPFITEMSCWIGPLNAPTVGHADFKMKFEIYVPPSYNMGTGIPATGSTFKLNVADTGGGSIFSYVINNAPTGLTSLQPGFNIVGPIDGTASCSARPNILSVRALLLDAAGNVLDGAPLGLLLSQSEILVPASNSTTDPGLGFPTSAQSYDPRVDKYASNWVTGPSTWGQPTVGSVLSVPSASPPQDTSLSGSISTNSFYIPGPKGSASNPSGQVQSVAELGLINTGSVVATTNTFPYGVPWRSIRLQQSKGETQPPDRSLMDLFMAPLPAADTGPVDLPETNVMAGTINPNTAFYPFTNTDPVRALPLHALLQGVTNSLGVAVDAGTISTNIATRVFAANGKNYTGQPYYEYPSELCEIAGLGDQGEEGEAVLRQFIDTTTLQGNVYRVYSLGQAIQQTPSGALLAQSERYVEAFIERYQVRSGATSTTHYRIVFWREIPL